VKRAGGHRPKQGRHVGALTLEKVRDELAELPENRVPAPECSGRAKLSSRWTTRVNGQIAEHGLLRDRRTRCVG
jgi:hypothetical protein